MDFVKIFSIEIEGAGCTSFNYSSEEMATLGIFLTSDVRCFNKTYYKEWALAVKANPKSFYGLGFGGNVTFIEEDERDGLIYLHTTFRLEEDEVRAYLKMTPDQLIKILDDWEHKVCVLRPQEVTIKYEQEVTIKYENDEFIFETG